MTGERSDHSSNRWIVPLVFLINLIVFYVSAVPLLDDSDVPWHLATGQLLWHTHQLPQSDPWSFASNDAPWYLLSWLWDAILGGVELLGGAFGVFLFSVTLCAGIMAFLAAALLKRPITLSAIFLTLMLAGLCMLDFITARPQVSGYALALIFYTLLHNSRGSNSYHPLPWLPLLMLLWANMHGSFIVGYTLLGAFIVEAWFARNFASLRRLLVIAAACLIATCINPYGPDILLGAMRTLGGSAKTYTLEWLPFTFSSSLGVSSWLVIFIMASNLRIPTAPLADKLLAIAWLIATMFTIRNGAIFILLSAPYLAACLDEQTKGLRETCAPSAFMRFMQRRAACTLWVTTALLFTLLASIAYLTPHNDRLQSDAYSVTDVADYALTHYPTRHFLTDFNFGGQIIYKTHGALPMFMDSRAATAYSEQAMQDYLDFMWLKPDWQPKILHYGVDGMIVSNTSRFAQAYTNGQYHDDWTLTFTGQNANIYLLSH